MYWQTAGTWRGVWHEAGDERSDYLAHPDEQEAQVCTAKPALTEELTPTEEPSDEPTLDHTQEPVVDPTDEPTDEPTQGETVTPTQEPTVTPESSAPVEPEATEDPSEEPSEAGQVPNDESKGPKKPVEESSPPEKPTEQPQQVVPQTVNAGVADDTFSNALGAGLVGGGVGLLLSSGGVLLGARRYREV